MSVLTALQTRSRITLRTLVALVALLAVVLGWWIALVKHRADDVARLRSLGFLVSTEPTRLGRLLNQPALDDVVGIYWTGGSKVSRISEIAPILSGYDHLKRLNLHYINDLTGAELAYLAPLSRIEDLDLSFTDLRDDDLSLLAHWPRLKRLNLKGTSITDEGLALMPPLPHLRELNLGHTRITDAGLAHLTRFPSLVNLSLARNHVTDAGMADLRKLKKLTDLDLTSTIITDMSLLDLGYMTGLLRLDILDTGVPASSVPAFRKQLKSTRVTGRRY